ncbi:unnamed protein product [Peniophora sp. CBMAI 1063]|nr:unnamed protein product [Peniophora sp. CBMAI 1063]
MATTASQRPLKRVARPHLSTVPSPQQAPLARTASTSKAKTGSLKRTRSLEQTNDRGSLKRQKAIAPSPARSPARRAPPAEREEEKEIKKEIKRAERENFKEKYSKAFPKFAFYIHADVMEDDPEAAQGLVSRIQYLGGHIEDFFSRDGVTHFITNELPEDGTVLSNKENRRSRSRNGPLLQSPIHLNGTQEEATQSAGATSLVSKAHAWNMKIWSVAKLESVLDRCDVPQFPSDRHAPRNAQAAGGRSLMSLVEHERLYGAVDSSSRNPDMHFFSRDSCFVLVEDMTSQLATIHAAEFPCRWTRDGPTGGTWPKLYAHPEVRNPFTEPNEREFRRWRRDLEQDKQKKDEHEREQLQALERERRRAAEAERLQQAQQAGDLRRSASMMNLRRRAISNASERAPGESMFDTPEMLESANASGYLRSQYAAASGNSVAITSTTGTTTSAGNSLLRSAQLPAALRGKEVNTTMKANGRVKSMMGPPPDPPQKALRKSKSTTTMRLPKREEGAKPGYCENCRKKYDDFETHINSKRHLNFAMDDKHFEALDMVLSRISRPMRRDYIAQHYPQTEELQEYDQDPATPSEAHVDRQLRSSSQPVSDYLPQPQPYVFAGELEYDDQDGLDVQVQMEGLEA